MDHDRIVRTIETAFADTPHPGTAFEDISTTGFDEEIVDYFRPTTWRGHETRDLRYHSVALSFFTGPAFRYWLPAFMLAELSDPKTADVIGENIAGMLGGRRTGPPLLREFTGAELDAVAAFLAHCDERYDGGFGRALDAVEAEKARRADP